MSYDFDKADAELKFKLGDDDYCLLGTSYEIADFLTQHTVDACNHLYSDHGCVEALELNAAIIKYIVYASQLEQRLFKQNAVLAPPRFDTVENVKEMSEVQRLLASELQAIAVAESAHSVRH